MPNVKPKLFGPDTKYGAYRDPSLKRYIWHAVWYEDGSRRRRSLGVERGGDYSAALAQAIASIDRPTAASGLISACLVKYLDEHRIHMHGQPQSLSMTRKLTAWWAGMTTADVTEANCRKYAEKYASRSTARTHLAFLSAALRYCLPGSAPDVWMPQPSEPRSRIVTEAEYELVHRDLSRRGLPHLALALHIAWFTAARIESILTLRWDRQEGGGHIDLEAGLIHLRPFGRASTSKQKPTIPIPKSLRPLLEAERRESGWVCESRRKTKLVYQSAVASLKYSCTQTGVKPFTWHALCHSRITALIEAGWSVHLIGQYAGRSAKTIERVYMHLKPKGGARDIAESL